LAINSAIPDNYTELQMKPKCKLCDKPTMCCADPNLYCNWPCRTWDWS